MNKFIEIFVCSLLGLLILSPFAIAGELEKKEKEEEAKLEKIKDVELEEIVVTSTKMVIGIAEAAEKADIPASVDVIGANQIEIENVDHSMELMRKVPATYFGDWNQGVISGTFSMRGFDPNHDAPVALIVDGIPYNYSYGRMNIQPFFPMEIERIELVKGTNDPQYGLGNIAGNLNVYTKRGGNYIQTKLLTGSYNTWEGNAVIAREKDGFSQTYFLGYRSTDGYRDHSDLIKGAFSGKWFYITSDNKLSVGVIARYFKMDANAPGYLSKQQAEENPRQMQSFSRTDGGEQEDSHISLHIDYSFTDGLMWSFKTYAQDMERTRWVRFSPAAKQQERPIDDVQYGALSKLSFETRDWGVKKVKLDWGLDYQKTDSIHQRFESADRVKEKALRDWEYTSWYWGTYLKSDIVITDWVRLNGGIRMDRFDGDFENKLTGKKLDMIDFGTIWQPKVGLVITPYRGYNIYGNWGRSFQIPADNERFGDIIGRDIDYSKNDGWETGIKLAPIEQVTLRLCYWEMMAADEVKLIPGEGVYRNIGETERKGWDTVLSFKPFNWATIWGSYSRQEGKYTEPGPAWADRKDKKIENVPEYTAKLGVDLDFPFGLSSIVWLESQGDYFIDPQNKKQKEGAYDIVNMNLFYRWMDVIFSLEVKNLFDKDYYGFVWNEKDGYGYSPGDKRSYYAAVSVKF